MITVKATDFTWMADKKWLVAEASDLRLWAWPNEIAIRGNKSTPSFKISEKIYNPEEELMVVIYKSQSVPGVEVHVLND